MKSKREYTDYLRDMLEASTKATQFVKDVDFEAFSKNEEKVYAVIRALAPISPSSFLFVSDTNPASALHIPKSVVSPSPISLSSLLMLRSALCAMPLAIKRTANFLMDAACE